MVLPPSTRSSKQLAKERVYIIDTSGSMGGSSIRQAKQALLQSLGRLNPEDNFNIIEFNSVTRSLFSHPGPANPQMISKAKGFVNGLETGGGTEMLPALQRALATPVLQHKDLLSSQNQRVRQVIFITDGAVNNELALMEKVKQSLGGQRLFTVGIGAAPNSYFMRKMAEFGRGTFTYIGHVNDVQMKMDALLRQLESPQLTDIGIQWPEGKRVEHYPVNIPDLYAGEPLLLIVKSSNLAGKIEISGRLANNNWSQSLFFTGSSKDASSEVASEEKGIAKRWAREKIESLLDQKVTARNPDVIRGEVLAVALKYQVMSPFTRFIAVEEIISRTSTEALQKRTVANTLPAKGSAKKMQYPQTSAGVNLLLSIGLILLALFFCLLFAMRQRADLRGSC